MCREKGITLIPLLSGLGSPPRMRGKVKMLLTVREVAGITPACAGKSYYTNGAGVTGGDHPRVCGEKWWCPTAWKRLEGSPPRMRGKVLKNAEQVQRYRITPAYAGKSSRNETCWHRPWDHPRVCGEKCPPGKFFFMTVGSPPRVRGKVEGLFLAFFCWRITPAYAGKRPFSAASLMKRRDHPRVCGEKLKRSGKP